MTSPTLSRISVSIATLPRMDSSNRSSTVVNSRPVSSGLYAMPVMPACHGRLYSAPKSQRWLRKRSSRLTRLGMRSIGSGSMNSSVLRRAANQLVGQMMSYSIVCPAPITGAIRRL